MKDGTERIYDPRRQQGVSVYREQERAFSVGDRVQLTAPSPELGLANRELGTVEGISKGRMTLTMDGGRMVEIDPVRHPHLDHGYAVTSHSSQGQTAGRVLIHADTELAAKDLLNHRMAYVAVSRGVHDAQLFTDNRERLGAALGRNVSHTSALAPEAVAQTMPVKIAEKVKAAPAVERQVAVEPKEKIHTAAEIERHHAPLRKALNPREAAQFEWIAETGTVQSYRHTGTGRHIHIDGKGHFYSQEGKPALPEAALARAMPEAWKQERREHSMGMGIGR